MHGNYDHKLVQKYNKVYAMLGLLYFLTLVSVYLSLMEIHIHFHFHCQKLILLLAATAFLTCLHIGTRCFTPVLFLVLDGVYPPKICI